MITNLHLALYNGQT